VEGMDLKVEVRPRLLDPVAHLRCSFLGEGEGQYLSRLYSLVEEVEDLLGDYPGFAGTGAGEDELEAAGGDGFGLLGIEGHLFVVGRHEG